MSTRTTLQILYELGAGKCGFHYAAARGGSYTASYAYDKPADQHHLEPGCDPRHAYGERGTTVTPYLSHQY
jgi:hypothetical protein